MASCVEVELPPLCEIESVPTIWVDGFAGINALDSSRMLFVMYENVYEPESGRVIARKVVARYMCSTCRVPGLIRQATVAVANAARGAVTRLLVH